MEDPLRLGPLTQAQWTITEIRDEKLKHTRGPHHQMTKTYAVPSCCASRALNVVQVSLPGFKMHSTKMMTCRVYS